jgi:hypothetical protein
VRVGVLATISDNEREWLLGKTARKWLDWPI